MCSSAILFASSETFDLHNQLFPLGTVRGLFSEINPQNSTSSLLSKNTNEASFVVNFGSHGGRGVTTSAALL